MIERKVFEKKITVICDTREQCNQHIIQFLHANGIATESRSWILAITLLRSAEKVLNGLVWSSGKGVLMNFLEILSETKSGF